MWFGITALIAKMGLSPASPGAVPIFCGEQPLVRFNVGSVPSLVDAHCVRLRQMGELGAK